jgi:hypothetical protein
VLSVSRLELNSTRNGKFWQLGNDSESLVDLVGNPWLP